MKSTKILYKAKTIAGLLLFVAGFVAIMGIITAEAYYPTGYSTNSNEISDLGSTRPPDIIIHQPSAMIFNSTMIVTGILIIIASYLLFKSKTKKLLAIPLAIFGIGIMGVGLFPGNTTPHPFFALITFFTGGVAAILTIKAINGPYRFVSLSLGIIALLALFMNGIFIPYIGDGGIERWIAYPIIFWFTGLGAYYLGLEAKK